MDWYPQQLFTAEQAAAGAFFFNRHAFVGKGVSLSETANIHHI